MSLVIDNLKKEYVSLFSKKKKILAVNNLSFTIKEGEVYALVGQNGAGKTSTIKCILKLINQTKGKVNFNNKDIYFLMENARVGYMPEILSFPDGYNLKKYLIEIGILRKAKCSEVLRKINSLAELLNMKEKMELPINNYSKGMKKKANFMQAVMHAPSFLVLDEPTDGLDAVSRRIVLDYIKRMSKNGCTILITSHNLADLERVACRAGIIHSGCLLDEVNVEQFKDTTCKALIRIANDKEFKEISIESKTSDIDINNYNALMFLKMEHVKWDMEEWYFNTLIKAGDINVTNYQVQDK